jgi:hypothetical protein
MSEDLLDALYALVFSSKSHQAAESSGHEDSGTTYLQS